MSVGKRIFTKIKRPAPELIKNLRGVPVANLADNMGRIYCVDSGIRPLNKPALCGPAFTVKCPSGDNLMFHKAMDMAQEGDIIVISGVGASDRSFSGELMFNYAAAKKLGGFVIDGYVRDLEGYALVDMPVYARGVQPNGPYKNGPGEINVPVAVGGQAVLPGDILVGDADGLVVIPAADAEEVLAAGKATLESETEKLRKYKSGETKPGRKEWVEQKLAAVKVEIVGEEE